MKITVFSENLLPFLSPPLVSSKTAVNQLQNYIGEQISACIFYYFRVFLFKKCM